MLTIFNVEKGVGRDPATIESMSLDALWARAEGIGRIEVDHSLGSKAYRVRIRFERRSGTLVWATGEDVSIYRALESAIQEAILLER